MKKIIACLMIAGTFILGATAQQQNKMNGHKHHHGSWMAMKELNLTTEQKQSLQTNREEYKSQLSALNKNENISVKDARDQRFALRKANHEKMMAILTPAQKYKLEQLKTERKTKQTAMAATRMDKMKAKLNLTDDQVAKIKASREAVQQQMKTIRDNDKLSRTEMKTQMLAVKEQNKNNIKSILTADQAAKMEQWKQERINKKDGK